MSGFFAMGGYAAFVWPAYAIVAAVMIGLWWVSRQSLSRSERELAVLEAQRPRRRPGARN